MGLPWSLPEYIDNPKEAFANSLQIHGFGTELLGGMLVDDSHYLEGEEASSYFYLIPVESSEPVTYSLGSFVADCLAFEHATPFQALPRPNSFSIDDVPWTIKPRHRADIPDLYLNDLTEAYERAAAITEGLWFHPEFRYDLPTASTVEHKGYEVIHLNFSKVYARVSQSLHLHNAAVRQTDPLGQFLNYYRIIENLTGTNGKSWVERSVGSLGDYKLNIFATHAVVHDRRRVRLIDCVDRTARKHLRKARLYQRAKAYNFTEVLRACAVARLDELKTHTEQQIARRFWNTNRCGISHGNTIRRHDIDTDFKEILADLKLVRYLARLIIEQNL
jgi:hypothetical protein